MATTWNDIKKALDKLTEEELKEKAIIAIYNPITKDYRVINRFDSNLLINGNAFDEFKYGTRYLEIF